MATNNYRGPRCRICGCTQDDCWDCMVLTGDACQWVALDLCSACVDENDKPLTKRMRQRLQAAAEAVDG